MTVGSPFLEGAAHPPTVFISYSWDSEEHKGWVLAFAQALVNAGIYVTLDQWHLPPGEDEHCDTGENRVEQIECANRADTNEVKKRAFDAQVSEGLVQALEDPVAALLRRDLTWHKPLDCSSG
jgi:hypothetical protein